MCPPTYLRLGERAGGMLLNPGVNYYSHITSIVMGSLSSLWDEREKTTIDHPNSRLHVIHTKELGRITCLAREYRIQNGDKGVGSKFIPSGSSGFNLGKLLTTCDPGFRLRARNPGTNPNARCLTLSTFLSIFTNAQS